MYFFMISGFMSVLFSISVAMAKAKKKKVYVVDFEDEFIEGNVKNPTIFHLFNKQQLEYDKAGGFKKEFFTRDETDSRGN